MSHLNVGNLDRVLRVVLGLGLISLAAAGIIGPWGYAGIVPLLTGLSARCPLYSVFGIATTSRLMAAFALASTLGLWLAQRLWSSLRGAGRGERFAAWPVRAAGALLAGSSSFALWHGLGAALCGVAP